MPAPSVPTLQTVALIGNPNTGKTTLFNALTGLSQQVGNYSGVTVERKIGRVQLDPSRGVSLLDLPGAYSLAAHSPDQMIVADALVGQQAGEAPLDAILAIVDASNLNRNLYLLSQLIETDLPLVVALNMIDVARAREIEIDAAAMSARLGVPVVPVCARRREGIDALREALSTVLASPSPTARDRPCFPALLQRQIDDLTGRPVPGINGAARSLSSVEALRVLVDQGGYAETRLVQSLGAEFSRELAARRQELDSTVPPSALETEARYRWIGRILEDCAPHPAQLQTSGSDRIDRVLTHRVFGLLFFVVVTGLVFQAIYAWATPLMDWIDVGFGAAGGWIGSMLRPGPLRSLLADGVIAGVGGVLVFLPQIVILFLFISLLEDCGYMARAALLMDRLLTRCGLSGKSFIPLISSFACAVPAIMATRTIEDRRDRFTTILVAPLMSCSARLPVYTIFIAAFIPDRPLLGTWIGSQGLALFAMYGIGILTAIPVAWLLKKSLLKGEAPAFLMELPTYKWPGPQTVFMRVYQNGRAFVVRAGSIIMVTTICMWALAYFPRPAAILERYEQQRARVPDGLVGGDRVEAMARIDRAEAGELLRQSLLGRSGRVIEPVVRPLGWDWRIGMATLASFPAREVVISVLGTIYSLGGEQEDSSDDLRRALRESTTKDGSPLFSMPVVLSIMVFFAFCAQCVSTLAVIQRETRSWAWAGLAFAYMTLLAYGAAFVVYRVATALGWGN